VSFCVFMKIHYEKKPVSCHSHSASASSTAISPSASELIVHFHGPTHSVHAGADTVMIRILTTYMSMSMWPNGQQLASYFTDSWFIFRPGDRL